MRVALISAIAAVILVLAVSADADIPQIVSYQGKVTDPGGNPVADGTYSMRFRIMDAASGGNVEWDSGTRSISVSGGIFNVLLGESPQPPLDLPFNENYWLLVTFEGVNQTPRQRLASNGYAYMASGLVPGTVVDGDLFVNGEIGIGTTSPNLSLDVESADATYTGIEITNTDGGEGRWAILSNSDGNTYAAPKGFGIRDVSALATRFTIDTDGKVGIGTLNPEHQLDVVNNTGIIAVRGRVTTALATAYGVWGESSCTAGKGVYGYASASTGTTHGVIGMTSSTNGTGVSGIAEATTGSNVGVGGSSSSTSGTGIYGSASATSGTTYGIYGRTSSIGGYGGYFLGDVHVTGALSKGSGSFVIDHPLDPENKLLRHNFIESPENLLIYRGKIELDANGEAVVKLPDYFHALTKEDEATVNLTPIGKRFLAAYEFQDDVTALRIFGDPGESVAWTVYADRDDPVIRQQARPVEEEKGPDNKYCDRGKLLNPTAYGYPESMGRDYELHERERRQAEERRAPMEG